MLPCSDDSATPEVARAARDLISAASRFMSVATGRVAEREQKLLDVFHEGGRVALEQALQWTEDALPAEVFVGMGHRIYREHQPGAATYLSRFGELRVRRRSFREVAVRNGPTVIALELCAGLIEGATAAFACSVSEGCGLHDMRKHQKVLDSRRRHVPPRATLERLAMRLGTRIDE